MPWNEKTNRGFKHSWREEDPLNPLGDEVYPDQLVVNKGFFQGATGVVGVLGCGSTRAPMQDSRGGGGGDGGGVGVAVERLQTHVVLEGLMI